MHSSADLSLQPQPFVHHPHGAHINSLIAANALSAAGPAMGFRWQHTINPIQSVIVPSTDRVYGKPNLGPGTSQDLSHCKL